MATFITFVAIFVFLVGTESAPIVYKLPSTMGEKLKMVDASCLKDTGAPTDSLDKLLSFTLPDNETSGKYMYCVCDKLNLLKEHGHFDRVRTLGVFSNVPEEMKGIVKNAVEECDVVNGNNQFDTVLKIVQCFSNKVPVKLSL